MRTALQLLLALCLAVASDHYLAGSGVRQAAKVVAVASLVPSEACVEYGGTDYCECLAHPDICRADSALYAQVWGKR
jgi:hypothetical protein